MIGLLANFLVNTAGLDYEKARKIARVIAAVLLVLVFLGLIYGWIVFKNWRLQNELEREREARSQEHQQRIEEARQETNKASENVNAVKNANYANLSNDQLRERIINAARKQK